MRVLGLAADGSFAVLETDGRTIEAFGPAGQGDWASVGEVELIGLQEGDAEALARTSGVPVATGFGPFGVAKAVYYRARVRSLQLERPTAVVDDEQTILIEENGLLITGGGEARSTIRAEALGRFVDAEAVAYLAARCWNGFPIAFPGTTGAPYPMTAGRIVRP